MCLYPVLKNKTKKKKISDCQRPLSAVVEGGKPGEWKEKGTLSISAPPSRPRRSLHQQQPCTRRALGDLSSPSQPLLSPRFSVSIRPLRGTVHINYSAVLINDAQASPPRHQGRHRLGLNAFCNAVADCSSLFLLRH